MNVFLLCRDRDFVLNESLFSNATELIQDLEMTGLFKAMAGDEGFLLETVQRAVLSGLDQPDAIRYRQQTLADCIEQPSIARELYNVAVEALERERHVWGWMSTKNPEGMVHHSIEVLQIFVELFSRLRAIAEEHSGKFRAESFTRLFAMFKRELSEEYLETIRGHLRTLTFRNGILMSAGLGKGNRSTNFILHKTPESGAGWLARLHQWVDELIGSGHEAYVYTINERDEAGFRILSDLKAQGLKDVAIALARSTDHIRTFFSTLRVELAFYLGCLNLHDLLVARKAVFCFPDPIEASQTMLSARELYDIGLFLSSGSQVIANDVDADAKSLVIVTGANRGGKSTFLRGVGLAQIMMQCGMFVPARSFRANVCTGIFTHFKREEDVTMRRGKFDEELSRMKTIVEHAASGSMVLLNESFASTNEREGAEIALQVVTALLASRVKVVYVTHMSDLAQGLYRENLKDVLFLRAERLADGRRTFRLLQAEPQPTSHAADLYKRYSRVRRFDTDSQSR